MAAGLRLYEAGARLPFFILSAVPAGAVRGNILSARNVTWLRMKIVAGASRPVNWL